MLNPMFASVSYQIPSMVVLRWPSNTFTFSKDMLFCWKNGEYEKKKKKKNHAHYFQPVRDSEATTIVNWENAIVIVCCLL